MIKHCLCMYSSAMTINNPEQDDMKAIADVSVKY